MKSNGSRWRIVDDDEDDDDDDDDDDVNPETRGVVLDFLLDSRGCVLLFEENFDGDATRLRLLSFNSQTTLTKTRDLVRIEQPRTHVVCVQITPFY